MTEDSSLTDFVGGGGSDGGSDDSEKVDSSVDDTASTDGDDTASADGDDTASADSDDTASADSDDSAAADPESVEPVAPTFTAAPEDEACSRCGAAVGIRWRAEDSDEYVCADCKEW